MEAPRLVNYTIFGDGLNWTISNTGQLALCPLLKAKALRKRGIGLERRFRDYANQSYPGSKLRGGQEIVSGHLSQACGHRCMAVGKDSENLLIDPGIRSRNWKGPVSLRLEVAGYLEGHAVELGIECKELACVFIPGVRQIVNRIQNMHGRNDDAIGRRKNICGATPLWSALQSISRRYTHKVHSFAQNALFNLPC